jgi:GNAT superfamily N-acetyltransferase
MDLHIQTVASDNLPEKQRRYFQRQGARIFGAEELKFEWAEPDWWIFAEAAGAPASWLALTERRIFVHDEPLRITGIGSVITLPDYRGRKLATRLMEAAGEYMMEDLSVDAGLLLCDSSLLHFYKRLGWEPLSGNVYFEQPAGRQCWEECAMVLHGLRVDWPPGDIDLNGLPW